MLVKCLELRDRSTFIPVICLRPAPDNKEQKYLLRRDGYSGESDEPCVIMIDAQCRGCNYDPYYWPPKSRTKTVAHEYIARHWHELSDGDVIDVQFILGETANPAVTERLTTAA